MPMKWIPLAVMLLLIALGVVLIVKGPAYDRGHDTGGRYPPTRQLGYFALVGGLLSLAFWLIGLSTRQP